MRNFNFKSESFQIFDIKNLINKLIVQNYSIKRIQNLLGLTPQQINDFLRYNFEPEKHSLINFDEEFEKNNDTSEYTYENLSPIEKVIYDRIK